MPKPLRILHLAESPYLGGINAHICSVVRAFQNHPSIRISVATMAGKRDDRWLFNALGEDNVCDLAAFMPGGMGRSAQFQKYISAGQFDIIHTHNYRSTIFAGLSHAFARSPVPVINTCHGRIVGRECKLRLYQWAELRLMRRLSATVAVSNFVHRWLCAKGVPDSHIRTIYNGYAPGHSSTTMNRNDLGIPPDAVVYLFAGRLVHGKGLREFMDGLRGIDGAYALIAGDGPLRADCEAVARAARVDAQFVGMQPDASPFHALADVVVLPSRMEALPMTLIEAAAHAKPVVASNVGGIPEVVANGETGLLVDIGDRAALRVALEKLTDPDLRTRLGAAAYRRWQCSFTLERMASALQLLYTGVVDRR